MAKAKQYAQIENSIFSSSRNYDPITQPDVIRVQIADGAVLVDNRFAHFGHYYVSSQLDGTREFWEAKGVSA